MAFGYQLLIDLYDCQADACDDLGMCYQFLDEIVIHLHVEKQAPPSLFRTDAARAPHMAGLSGWVPLLESSVVIHTLTNIRYVSLDIFSCKCFDQQSAIDFTRSYFAPRRVESRLVLRGQDVWSERSSLAGA
jgi:S-adenosylmethionine decarboxylase